MTDKFFRKRLEKIYGDIFFYEYAIPEGRDRLKRLIDDGAPVDWTDAFTQRIYNMERELNRLMGEERILMDFIRRINQ